jgi:hypothetical protein
MAGNRPNTHELVESVREMLEGQLLPALTDKGLVYSTRVAVNILKIVERELQQIDGLIHSETESLRSVLGAQDGDVDLDTLNSLLVAKINQGEFDSDNKELLAHFQRSVLGKIAIDNPLYSTYKHYLDSGELTRY